MTHVAVKVSSTLVGYVLTIDCKKWS